MSAAKVGERHPNYGKSLSPETRSKISAAVGGENHPQFGKRGDLCPHWRGGIQPANKLARNTIEQRQWIKDVLARDDYTCQDCGARGVHLHAHHIKSFAEYPELRTVLENGITLCVECHRDLTWPSRKETAA